MSSDRVASIIWLIFGLVLAEESYRLNIGKFNKPDSGLFPFLVGLSLILLSSMLLVQTFINKSEKRAEEEKLNYRNIILCILSLYAYTLIFEWLGFIPSTFFLVAFLLKIIEKKGWLLVITASCLISIASYVLFAVWLQAPLPKGIFGI
jgi:putative tricarboxylic transport membrane protein